MAAYLNCYTILEDVRRNINEYNANLLAGTSTSGKFGNDWLVTRINSAQRYIYNKILKAKPEKFRTSVSVTVSDSVITLPWNYGGLFQLKDSNGRSVFRSNEKVLPLTAGTGTDRLYFETANNTLTLNKSGVNDTYTLWYKLKPRDITQGAASGDNTLATTAKAIADYYNDMIIEDITSGWAETISDCSAARVITLTTNTLTSGDTYGIVSELPEPFHELISPLATMIAKAIHPTSQEKPTQAEWNIWKMQYNAAMDAHASEDDDISIEEIFTDYQGNDAGPMGVTIPELGYQVF